VETVEVTAPQTIEVVRLQGAETPDPTQSVYISVPDCTIDTFETYPDAFFSPAGYHAHSNAHKLPKTVALKVLMLGKKF